MADEQLENQKLRLEIEQLQYESGRVGRFSQVIWPIVSAVATSSLAVFLGLLTYRLQFTQTAIQEDQAALKRREIFLTALQNATDTQKGFDARIAGMWVLKDYWDSDESTTVANALSAILISGPQGPSSEEETYHLLRLNAGEVIGEAIPERRYLPPEQWARRANKLSKILYGDGHTGEPGTITRLQWYLVWRKSEIRKGTKWVRETDQIEQRLQATRDAIRWNWKFLENCHFGKHDLAGIQLYEADLKGANFVSAILSHADLQDADLTRADLSGVDLRGANLYKARMDDIKNWKAIKDVEYANIKSLQSAPQDFRAWALDRRAVEIMPDVWSLWIQKGSPKPLDWPSWRAKGFPIDRNGQPGM